MAPTLDVLVLFTDNVLVGLTFPFLHKKTFTEFVSVLKVVQNSKFCLH